MKYVKTAVSISFVFACLACTSTLTAAPVAAIDVTNVGSVTSGIAVPVVEGWQFNVNFEIRVEALGLYDFQGNGLDGQHDIGLWDSNQALIASAVIPAGTGTPLMDNFRYVTIAPVTLTAGETYVIAGFYPQPFSDPIVTGGGSNTITSHPHVTWVERRRELANSLQLPTQTSSSGFVGSFGPSFLLTAVPEPASGATFLVSSMVYGLSRRRRN